MNKLVSGSLIFSCLAAGFAILSTGCSSMNPASVDQTRNAGEKNAVFFTPDKIFCGAANSLITDVGDGKLYGTGLNAKYQLGIGTTTDLLKLADLKISNVASVAPGVDHTLVLKNDGTVWVAGDNTHGQSGAKPATPRKTWTKMAITNVKTIAAGDYFSLALKKDGTLWATGSNFFGQFGTGDTARVYGWKQILTNVSLIAAGSEFCIAKKTDGSIVGAGRNQCGQLALGNKTNRKVWTRSKVDQNVSYLVCGRYNSWYRSNLDVYCAGLNSTGQLGVGDYTDRTTWTFSTQTSASICPGVNYTFFSEPYLIGFTGASIVNEQPNCNTWDVSTCGMITFGSGWNHAIYMDYFASLSATGSNVNDQLGMGDRKDRSSWTVVPFN